MITKIKRVLGELSEFHCIGNASNYNESMNSILKDMPNLIFVNIDLLRGNPFNFVHELNQHLKSDTEVNN